VVLVTGSDSAVIAGRKAQLAAWKREFSARPRMVYERVPESVAASAVEPVAMEQGTWRGVVAGRAGRRFWHLQREMARGGRRVAAGSRTFVTLA
jgi:hypothetical protein